MRDRMIGDTKFHVGVFIGGMDGVLDEFAMFCSLHPRAARWPIASTGAAAKELFEKEGARRQLFADEMTYATLFGIFWPSCRTRGISTVLSIYS